MRLKIINIKDHPGNHDTSAILVGSINDRTSVYKTDRGYVASLGNGLAVDGFFKDEGTARHAAKKKRRDDHEPRS